MKTKAVRLYGQGDLRLEEFELPPIADDEILCKVISDSICMSSYKAQKQGTDHKRIPDDVAENPIMIGHEFCGEIVEVGAKWVSKFKAGQKFAIQPALNFEDGPVGMLSAPGYSYRYVGGDATYVIMPKEVMEQDCLLGYEADAFFLGSLAEPVSCVIGATHANYHGRQGSYVHEMDIKEGGNAAILAGVGPMGLAMIDYLLGRDRKPRRMVVTDIAQDRLDRAASIFTVEYAAKQGVELSYVNTSDGTDLQSFVGGEGYDDVFVFAPVPALVEQASALLAKDGCLNFFAGPNDPAFAAKINFYDVHYAGHHIAGTSGGNNDDLREAVSMISAGRVNPRAMITHVGGLDAVIETTKHLPEIPGGKKLIYTHKKMDLVAIAEFGERGKSDPFYAALDEICARNNGLWSPEAERYVLEHAPAI